MDGEVTVAVDDGAGGAVFGADEGFDGVVDVVGVGPAEAAVEAGPGCAVGSVFDEGSGWVVFEAVVGDELGAGERGQEEGGGGSEENGRSCHAFAVSGKWCWGQVGE